MNSENTTKWVEALTGKNAYEAFKIIWSPDRRLDVKQRKALVQLWEKLNKKSLLTPSDSEWWDT